MPKYPGISPYDNEKGTLGTAKKRWEKLYVKEIESDTVSGINATIENLATTAENSVSAAVSAKNDAVSAKQAAEAAQTAAETAAAGIQSVVETDVDNTLSIAGVAADAKVTGDWLRDIAKPVTLDTSMPATAYADEFMKVTTDSEGRVLYGVKRDGTFTWQKGVPKHLQDKINELAAPTIDNDEYMYVMLDSEGHVLFGVKRDGSFDWQKGLPKPVKEKLEEVTQTVIDSEEFVQLTQDADGKLIEGVRNDGTKVFFSTTMFLGDVLWSKENIDTLIKALKESDKASFFDFNKYSETYVYGNPTGLKIFYLDGDVTGMTKDDKVNLTYRFGEQTGMCTCKWQGASSINFPKKNYTIAKLTPAIDVGWGMQKKYCLKAEYADASYARNIVSAKLWGETVKTRVPANARLSDLPNGGAIDGFPIMLVINGEYQGLYNFNIPKDPWMFGMGSGSYEAIFTAEDTSDYTKFKAVATKEEILSAQHWEIEYVPDEDNPDWAISSFNRMVQAVIDSTGNNYRDTLQDYLDIESAIDYFILVGLLGGADNISHNNIVATYDGTKWFFTVYDLDWTFGAKNWNTSFFPPDTSKVTFKNMQDINRVMHLIYTYDKAALKARYWELREKVFSESNITDKIFTYLAPIPKAVMNEESNIWPSKPGTLTSNFEQMINWYELRCKYLDKEIEEL